MTDSILSLARAALEDARLEAFLEHPVFAREVALAKAVVELSEQLAEQQHHSDAFDARIESIANGLSAVDRAIHEAERDSLRAELEKLRLLIPIEVTDAVAAVVGLHEQLDHVTRQLDQLVIDNGRLTIERDSLSSQLAATQEALTEACVLGLRFAGLECDSAGEERFAELAKLGAKP